MRGTKFLADRIATLLAADTGSFGDVAFLRVGLTMNDFTPSVNTVIGDLTLSTFDGSTPIDTAVTGALVTLDPVTGDSILVVKAPAGGFFWETTGLTNLPQSITGAYVRLAAGAATLMGTMRLPADLPLSVVGQGLNLESPSFRIPLGVLNG